ncbi:MAG: aldehyde dehydrogenase family protein [Sphingobium sp.]
MNDRMLIDGQWTEGESGRRIEVRNPATGEVFAAVSEGDAGSIDQAVAAARASFEDGRWRDLPPATRGKILWRLADLLEANADEIARLETSNVGMPLVMAHYQVSAAAEALRYFAGWATKIHGRSTELNNGFQRHMGYTLREPVGVVGAIVPWNAPLLMVAWKLGPALAAGCSTVLKPAENTPLTALAFGRLALEAGIPAGVVNVVPGYGATAGAALAAHMDVDKLSFTGSTNVGRELLRAATGNFKRLTLELGGKSPFIICEDAALDEAIGAAQMAILANCGQNCSAGSRLIVHRSVYDRVLEGVAAGARGIPQGDGLDPASQIGPLVSQKQLERVSAYIESGKAGGATVVAGGERLDRPGYFVQPTVFADVAGDLAIAREEIFGPVLVVSRFDEVDEAVAMANDTDYGLASYVWSQDAKRPHQIARRIRAGTVWVNTALAIDPSLPVGGFKQSGWGRENGPDGIEAYLETKSVIAAI